LTRCAVLASNAEHAVSRKPNARRKRLTYVPFTVPDRTIAAVGSPSLPNAAFCGDDLPASICSRV
jgi:hypothetical protein